MKSKNSIGILFPLIAIILLASCVNLKHVNDFSASSVSSLTSFESINYSFRQNCTDQCFLDNIISLAMDPDNCDCILEAKADTITLAVYFAVKGYFDGLASLSQNELTRYNTAALKKALTEGSFGAINVNKGHVESYSRLSEILLRSFTDEYRKNKLRIYITEANEPVKNLLAFLEFNLASNLYGKIEVQKERLRSFYFDLIAESNSSHLESTKILKEYYNQIQQLNLKQQQILTYAKMLRSLAQGHAHLAENVTKLEESEIRSYITRYSNSLRDINSEFKKLKN